MERGKFALNVIMKKTIRMKSSWFYKFRLSSYGTHHRMRTG